MELTMKISVLFFFFCIPVGNAKAPEKIIGGEIAENGEFPFHVSIRHNGIHNCGGAIIDASHIITVAHCFYKQDTGSIDTTGFDVLIGTNVNLNYKNGKIHFICRIIVHRDFYFADPPQDIRGDIAILKLREPIDFHSKALPIKLPSSDIREHTVVSFSGWGCTNSNRTHAPSWLLKKATLVTINNKLCATHYGHLIAPENFCALYSSMFACSSFGDSGSPLDDGINLVGLLTLGYPHDKNMPEVFIHIYKFVPWIKKVIKFTSDHPKKNCFSITVKHI